MVHLVFALKVSPSAPKLDKLSTRASILVSDPIDTMHDQEI